MYGCHNITIILIKAVKSPCIAWVSIQDIHSYYLVISSQRLNFMIKSYAISAGDTRSWYSYWLVINRPQLYTKHYIAKSYLHWQFIYMKTAYVIFTNFCKCFVLYKSNKFWWPYQQKTMTNQNIFATLFNF